MGRSCDVRAILAFAFAFAFACVGATADGQKGVSITLTTEWTATSVVLETAEFFADESDAAYWAFVETWAASTEPRDKAMKDEDPDAFFARCASRVRDVAAKVAGPDFRHGVLELSLGIRRYSPRLEMFRAVAREHAESVSGEVFTNEATSPRDGPACCLARAGNASASDLATLREMLADLERQPLDKAYSVPRASNLDHAYPAPAPAPALDAEGGEGGKSGGGTGSAGASSAAFPAAPAVTLYASLGSDCFASFHDALRGAAERGAVRYLHRPVLLDAACALQGDGCVALGAAAAGSAISGDASGDSAGSGSGPGSAPPAEGARLMAAGYGVEMAIKNMEYKAIDDASVGEDAAVSAPSGVDESAPELKLRQIRDLGLQATQRVARSDDPLQTMMDLSFDFPAIAA